MVVARASVPLRALVRLTVVLGDQLPRFGDRFFARRDLSGQDPVVQSAQDCPKPRPGVHSERHQRVTVDDLMRSLKSANQVDVLDDVERLSQDWRPPGRPVGTRFAVRDEYLQELEEQREALAWAPLRAVFLLADEPNLLAAAHLREVCDSHVVSHQVVKPEDVLTAESQPPPDVPRLASTDGAMPAHVLSTASLQSIGLPDVVKNDSQFDDRIADERVGDADGGQRVHEDVPFGVIRLRLWDPLARGELREDGSEEAQLVHQSQTLRRLARAKDPDDLLPDPLVRDHLDSLRAGRNRRRRLVVDLPVDLTGEANRAEHAEVVLREPGHRIPDRPNSRCSKIGHTTD